MAKKACRNCKFLTDTNKCPSCNGDQFSESWKGKLIIINPLDSEIAKKLTITKKGEYAVKI